MNGLLDLRSRLVKADAELIAGARRARAAGRWESGLEEARRLEAKAEGVRLAMSYVDDALRIQTGSGDT